jgi:20S proteasome alpha/beta subunit
MTASGASKHLFLFYSSAVGKTPADVPIISLLSIFWDEEDRSCHLYKLDGGSRLSEDRYACIGSGGLFIEREAKKLQVGNSKEELFFQAKSLLLAAAEEDKATNERVFYGLIENGHFSTGEEVTR